MTVELITAVIAASAAIVAALISARNGGKIQQVHLLVNSQLHDVLEKLELTIHERNEALSARDDAVAERDAISDRKERDKRDNSSKG